MKPTSDDLRRAFEAGFEKALGGVWYADNVELYRPEMFEEWHEADD